MFCKFGFKTFQNGLPGSALKPSFLHKLLSRRVRTTINVYEMLCIPAHPDSGHATNIRSGLKNWTSFHATSKTKVGLRTQNGTTCCKRTVTCFSYLAPIVSVTSLDKGWTSSRDVTAPREALGKGSPDYETKIGVLLQEGNIRICLQHVNSFGAIRTCHICTSYVHDCWCSRQRPCASKRKLSVGPNPL